LLGDIGGLDPALGARAEVELGGRRQAEEAGGVAEQARGRVRIVGTGLLLRVQRQRAVGLGRGRRQRAREQTEDPGNHAVLARVEDRLLPELLGEAAARAIDLGRTAGLDLAPLVGPGVAEKDEGLRQTERAIALPG